MKIKLWALLLSAFLLAGVCLAKDAVSDDMIYNKADLMALMFYNYNLLNGGGCS